MRLLHTSDWHLGKRLYKLDRSEEHELFLNWLINTIIEEKIDVLLIAGDVFDTPTPPHQSLEIFYNFLHRVSTETKTQTMIIAGNHDSGLLLEAPAKILTSHRVKVWGKLSQEVSNHWIQLGNIDLCAIPFFRSYELLPHGEENILNALNKYLTREKIRPQILMLHHLAGIYEAAGSEQVISLSGLDSIPSESLKNFDYVALGHIHRPQKIASQSYYSGSPIPLRFSETIKKTVVIIDEESGVLTPKVHPVPVFRNLFGLKTNEADYKSDIKNLQASAKLKPMVEIQIELSSPKVGLINEIKEMLEAKNMELLSFIPDYHIGENENRPTEKLFKLSTLDLFEEFYLTKFPDTTSVPEDLRSDFMALVERVKDASSTT